MGVSIIKAEEYAPILYILTLGFNQPHSADIYERLALEHLLPLVQANGRAWRKAKPTSLCLLPTVQMIVEATIEHAFRRDPTQASLALGALKSMTDLDYSSVASKGGATPKAVKAMLMVYAVVTRVAHNVLRDAQHVPAATEFKALENRVLAMLPEDGSGSWMHGELCENADDATKEMMA